MAKHPLEHLRNEMLVFDAPLAITEKSRVTLGHLPAFSVAVAPADKGAPPR
jgi:hypothetical protein